MKIRHLVKIHFDRRRPDIHQQWLNDRYKFFAENTLRSLRAQTFQDFTVWFCCGVGMEDMVVDLINTPNLPKWMITFGDCYPIDRVDNSDYTYVTRIDSDDLYSWDALQLANDCRPKEMGRVEASMFCRGYIHDIRTKRTGLFLNPSPPFHTMMIPTPQFIDSSKYRALDIGDHSVVRGRWNTQILPHFKFAVLVHDNNFLTDFNYSRDEGLVEKNWSPEYWMPQPVTFDLDDFDDKTGEATLADLDELKLTYPKFKCTLFTIPRKTSIGLLKDAKSRDWIELAVHGSTHTPNQELSVLSPQQLWESLKTVDHDYYVRGFRPPGWYITPQHIKVLSDANYWCAIHADSMKTMGHLAKHGIYFVDDRKNNWHGHTHDVCGNWLHSWMPRLKTKWRMDQAFAFVSESILSPTLV